ncbi:DnaJ domain-containing protein [Trichoderma velutinum]
MGTRETRYNYYDILNVPMWAETDDIRASYKRLALKHHPDKNTNNPDATAFFQTIQAAHSALTDPLERSAYDEHLCMYLDFALHEFREKKKVVKEDLHNEVQNLVERHRIIEAFKRLEVKEENECKNKNGQKHDCPLCPWALRARHEAAAKYFRDVIAMKEDELASLKAEINKMKININAVKAREYKR